MPSHTSDFLLYKWLRVTKWLYHVTLLSAIYENSCCSTFLPTLGISRIVKFNNDIKYVILSFFSLTFNFHIFMCFFSTYRVIANTLFQKHKRRLSTWTSRDSQHRNQIDYILCSQRRRSSIQSVKTTLGADCGSNHKLLIAKFRLKLKKVGKTTRPFRYDLNQIPYDYTVEVRNRFKGLDLNR